VVLMTIGIITLHGVRLDQRLSLTLAAWLVDTGHQMEVSEESM